MKILIMGTGDRETVKDPLELFCRFEKKCQDVDKISPYFSFETLDFGHRKNRPTLS